jgi:alpha-glucosidase
MCWDDAENAGFTMGTPWLPLSHDYAARNVQALAADPHSILNLYHRLINLRRAQPALSSGAYVALQAAGDVLAFERRHGQSARLLVALNLAHVPAQLNLPQGVREARLLISTELDREGELIPAVLTLRAEEGVVLELLTE